jgi:hypothetical protein
MRSSSDDRPSFPIDEPVTKAPPKPAQPPAPPEQHIKPVDPFDVARPQFKVRLFELLRLRVPTELEGEITQADRAGNYLIVDKYFHFINMGKFKHIGIEPLECICGFISKAMEKAIACVPWAMLSYEPDWDGPGTR